MQIKRIKWGILGTSPISHVMAEAIIQSDTGDLVAIGSRQHESAANFANKFSIPSLYTQYQSLIEDPNIDVVYLGLPNHLHKEWIIRAAEAGKHVLCEKPIVAEVKELLEVMLVLRRAQVFCMEGLMYRHHPFTQKIQELVASGNIGKPILYQAAYTANIATLANPAAGGSIRNLGCYPISLVRLIAGAEPVEMRALGRLNARTQNDHQASIVMKFPDESIAVVSTADDIEMHWQFDIYGTEGSLKVITNPWSPDMSNNKIMMQRHDQHEPTEIVVHADKPLFVYQVDVVGNSILQQSNQHTGISLTDSLGNMTVLDAWLCQITERIPA